PGHRRAHGRCAMRHRRSSPRRWPAPKRQVALSPTACEARKPSRTRLPCRCGQRNLPQRLAVQGYLLLPVREMLERPTLRLQGGSRVTEYRARRPDEVLDAKRNGPVPPPGAFRGGHAGPQTDVVRSLQRLAGNGAVTAWLGQVRLQRDDAGTAVKAPTTATPTPTPAADPAADAKALIADADSLKTNSGTATWLLKAQDLGFITFTEGMKTQSNPEEL